MSETPRTIKNEESKSRLQEKSYHKLFKNISDYCVARGIDVPMAMEVIENYRPEITDTFVKSTWKAILKSQTGKGSTTQQTKEDVKNVQEEFGKMWGEITGEYFDFPSYESLAEKQLLDNG